MNLFAYKIPNVVTQTNENNYLITTATRNSQMEALIRNLN